MSDPLLRLKQESGIAPGLYEHYKGGLYVVQQDWASIDSEVHGHNHLLVTYFSLTKCCQFTRPASHFTEQVMVDGEYKPRFRSLSRDHAMEIMLRIGRYLHPS